MCSSTTEGMKNGLDGPAEDEEEEAEAEDEDEEAGRGGSRGLVIAMMGSGSSGRR